MVPVGTASISVTIVVSVSIVAAVFVIVAPEAVIGGCGSTNGGVVGGCGDGKTLAGDEESSCSTPPSMARLVFQIRR